MAYNRLNELEAIGKSLAELGARMEDDLSHLPYSLVAEYIHGTQGIADDIENEIRGLRAEATPATDTAIAALTPAPAPVRDEVEIPEGWIAHDGGDCPVPIGTRIEIRTRTIAPHQNGIRWTVTESAPRWSVSNAYDDIIAYRIIEASATEDANHIEGVSGVVPVPGTGEESRDQSDDTSEDGLGHALIGMGYGDDGPDQSAYTDADAGLEPGNLTPAEIDAATAELFDRAGELDGLDAEPEFAPVVAVDEYVNAYPLMPGEAFQSVGPALNADMQDAREQRATNPEADERAKALDWYSPENVAKRNKITIFGVEFGGKKVDA